MRFSVIVLITSSTKDLSASLIVAVAFLLVIKYCKFTRNARTIYRQI